MSPIRCYMGMIGATDALAETDAGVQAEAPGPTNRRLVSPKEYENLPLDCQRLHDCLMLAPEGKNDICIQVPPGILLHDGWPLVINFEDFKDILYAKGRDKWFDCSFMTIFSM